MRSVKTFIRLLALKCIYFLLPGRFRKLIISLLLAVEDYAPPREAVRWLLAINDEVGIKIDFHCLRWGNGVHIKHVLMEGIHSFFYNRIPRHSNVLDIGCGYGAVANAIASHSDSIVLGMDMEVASINYANVHYQDPRLTFILGNVLTDLPEGSAFNVIVLSSVLEHLERRVEFLKELKLRFNPEKFLIRVPTFDQHYFKALKRELGLFAYVDPTHIVEYTPHTFADEMEQVGLGIEHLEIRWGDIWAECVPY